MSSLFLVRVRVPQPREKENPANWRDFSFLFFVLSVDSLDFLSDEIHVILQFLNFAVHLVDEAVTLLRGSIEETEVILIGLYLLLDGFILTEQSCAFVIKCILTAFSHLLQTLFEVVQTTLGNTDVQLLIELVEYGMVFLVELIFLFERHMTDGLILLNELLNLLLQTL